METSTITNMKISEYLAYLLRNHDPFPVTTLRNVWRANGTWVVDGAHSMSRRGTGHTIDVQTRKGINGPE